MRLHEGVLLGETTNSLLENFFFFLPNMKMPVYLSVRSVHM